jgi:hypothetical protein
VVAAIRRTARSGDVGDSHRLLDFTLVRRQSDAPPRSGG